jgi:hypothetical protein
MDRCWTEKPPLYTPDAQRAVACFLYDASPAMQSADVSTVFVR